jgi:hypothetical protein
MIKKTQFFIFILMIFYSTLSLADSPFCSSNQTEDLNMDGQGSTWRFPTCYVTPSSFKVQINSISLIKQDGTAVSFYAPASPSYTDLTQGIADLAQNVTPVDGIYTALRMKISNIWKVNASMNFTDNTYGTFYCRTKAAGFGGSIASNTSLTGNGLASFLHSTNVTSEEMSFKNNAFNVTPPNATASFNQCNPDYSWCNFPYTSKMHYDINANGVNSIDYYFTSANHSTAADPERDPYSVDGATIDVNFITPVTVTTATDASYKISIDISKAIGFSYNFTNAIGYQNDPDCNYMTLGPLPITLEVTQ